MEKNRFIRGIPVALGIGLLLLYATACLKSKNQSPIGAEAQVNPDLDAKKPDSATSPLAVVEKSFCQVPSTSHQFVVATPKAMDSDRGVTFEQIRRQISTACSSCHLAPNSKQGGFTYADSYQSQKMVVNDQLVDVAGIYESAKIFQEVLSQGQMPPANIRQKNPDAYQALGALIDAWIDGGKLDHANQADSLNAGLPSLWGDLNQQQSSDLGNCLPDEKIVGTDTNTDYFFEKTEELPNLLADTDLASMDGQILANRGTLAYNIEYPLWNDHTQKLRHIHVPAIIKEGKTFRPEPLAIKRQDRKSEPYFLIPENTRTYKTFFRGMKEVDGTIRYRPIETRLIVTRYAPRKPLFGTYVWSEDGSEARLLKESYRDGTPWKDLTLAIDFNKQTGTKRNYMVPAKHRCDQCHSGAANDSYVLGFTPLQLNRRDMGEGARDEPVGKDELSQVSRFVTYGLLTPKDAAQLPKLEYFPATRILDDHTLRAQGYMLGNCSHCHNPKGFAKLQAEIPMDFSAGRIFNFDTNLTSKAFSNRKIVHHEGDLVQSYLYFRVAAADSELRTEVRMPLHSLASPDCRAVTLMARWIMTYDPLLTNFDIFNFNPGKFCNKADDFDSADISVLEQDPTDAGGPYKPRREDWNDSKNGMTDWFRSLSFEDGLHRVSSALYAVDWWQATAECKFPTANLDPAQIKTWMMKPDNSSSSKPFGQLYWTTPGAYFFNLTCVKCHGRLGEANGPLAANLDTWSGGSIRVANFRKGMFGGDGSHIQLFKQKNSEGKEVDLSGNYFIWMALEGTKMNPPPEVADLLGANKAQMLKTIVDRCARQIPTHPKAAKPYFRDYDLFNDICTYNNLPVTDGRLQFDADTSIPVNQEVLDEWLRKSAANAGWAIYDYVRMQLAKGVQQVPQGECESVFKE